MSRSLREIVHHLFERAGLEVHKHSSRLRSPVFDDPYEALFAQHPRIVFKFPTRLCVDKLGFSYGGWHPWVETAKQLMQQTHLLAYPESVLKAFYDVWSFPLVESVFGANTTNSARLRNHLVKIFHGGFLPFSRCILDDLERMIETSTSYLESDNKQLRSKLTLAESLRDDGTWSDAKGEVELRRLDKLLQSIKASGYQRDNSLDGDIQGYLLRRDKTFRFVIVWGLHRASTLSALQYEQLTVRLFLNLIIDTDSIASWPLVRQGVWPREAAERYFHNLFDFDSEEWVRSNRSALQVGVSDRL